MALEPAASVPEQIGRYRIIKPLGQGGMGSVYLAEDPELDRLVALKVPNLGAGMNTQVLERFKREGKAAANLRHANICPVFDIGDYQGTPYLAMAYIEGRSLSDYLQTKSLTPKQAVALVRKLALALQEAHQHGVIHRDLKPSNVMLDKRGEPIIMDFGLARRMKHDPRLTHSGAILGTPAYMPPEQISGGSDSMGPGCDIYSLGVMFYEILTGRLPFTGDAMAMLAQILTEQPPPPSKIKPEIDPPLEQICLKAMAKKPEERYGSMAEFAAALLDYVRGGSTISPPMLTPPPPQGIEKPGVPVSKIGGRRSLAQLHRELEIPKDAPAFTEPRRRRKSVAGLQAVPPWIWIAAGGAALAVVVGMALLIYSIVRSNPSGNEVINAETRSVVKGDGTRHHERAGSGEADPGRGRQDQHKTNVDSSGATNRSGDLQPKPPVSDEWISLFNGKDLAGWSVAKGPPDKWFVQDGDIVGIAEGNARDQWLLTDKDYDNFVLRLEYGVRQKSKASAGVTARAMPSDPNFRPVKLMDDNDRSDWSQQKGERTGTVWSQSLMLSPLRNAKLKPGGQWNELEMTLNGKSLVVSINGDVVQDLSVAGNIQQAAEYPLMFRNAGRIGLQAHTSIVRFRNIKLKRLTAGRSPDKEIPLKPELVALRELPGGQNKSGPWLAGDGRTLYWADKQGAEHSIWRAERAAAGEPFRNSVRVVGGHDLTVSVDGTEMILVDYDPKPPANTKFALFAASVDAPLASRRKLTELSGYGFIAAPCLSADGLTLYAEQFGDRSLPPNVRFRRPNRTMPWGKAEAFPILGLSSGSLRFPFISGDGRYLFGNNDMAPSGMVMLTSTDGGKGFGSPKSIDIPGAFVKGKFPRYSAATNELFFGESTTGKTSELYVIKNFDPKNVK